MPELDPITLQVMLGGLRAACEEMGAVLIRSAHSANIKERRDCSTALFDAEVVRGVPAERVDGPAVVELPEATLVVPPGWTCGTADDGTIVVERG